MPAASQCTRCSAFPTRDAARRSAPGLSCILVSKRERRRSGGRIAHYKAPRHIRFKEALPLTVAGKPQKFPMREEMAKELGLADRHAG